VEKIQEFKDLLAWVWQRQDFFAIVVLQVSFLSMIKGPFFRGTYEQDLYTVPAISD